MGFGSGMRCIVRGGGGERGNSDGMGRGGLFGVSWGENDII